MKSHKWIIGLLIFIFVSQGIAQDIEFLLSKFEPKLPNPKSMPITEILSMISDSSSFYVGTYGEGVFRYPIKGQWIQLNDDLKTDSAQSVTGLAWLKVKDQTFLCLGSKAGLFISSDEGIHWEPVEFDYKINCLTAVNNFDSLIFVGTDNGIYKINNLFKIEHIGLQNQKVVNIVAGINRFGTHYLYAVADDSLYCFVNEYRLNKYSFYIISRENKSNLVQSVAIHPEDPCLIYIGIKNQGLFRAEEGGKKLWQDISYKNMINWKLDILFVDYKKPNELYASYYNEDEPRSYIYKSENCGLNWYTFNYAIPNKSSLDSLRFLSILKISKNSFIIGTKEGQLLHLKQKIVQKHGCWFYNTFFKGKRTYLTVGLCLLGWGICELIHQCTESDVECNRLPNPPDFP